MASFIEKKLREHGIDPATGNKNKSVKKSKIKKFENVYKAPIAYVGLMDLTLQESSYESKKEYRGYMDFDTAVGQGKVKVAMNIEVEGYERSWDDADGDYAVYEEMRRRFKTDPNDTEAETYLQNYKLRDVNMLGYQKVSAYGSIQYYVTATNEPSNVFSKKSPRFASVDDFINWIDVTSNEAWGEVTIAVRDLAPAMESYNDLAQALPETIGIETGEFGTLVLKPYYDYSHAGYENRLIESKEKISVDIDCKIMPNNDDKRVRDDDIKGRTFTPTSYTVSCKGTITDNNTQTSPTRNTTHRDNWERDFGYQGALSLEDAKQILQQNIQEVLQEWNEYIESERNYVTVGHGVGYQRTTENTEEWNYNFGDTQDDVSYENFQTSEMKDRVKQELHDIVTSQNGFSWYTTEVEAFDDGDFKIDADFKNSPYAYEGEVREEFEKDPEGLKNKILDAIKTEIQMRGYEIIQDSLTGDRIEILVRPTIAKTRKMKKSIRKSFLNMKKHLGEKKSEQ